MPVTALLWNRTNVAITFHLPRSQSPSFDGAAQGECIFTGSRSPNEAYSAWWGSDGHRFVMFSAGANTLGVGSAGSGMWTLNTGGKNWPSPAPAAAGARR